MNILYRISPIFHNMATDYFRDPQARLSFSQDTLLENLGKDPQSGNDKRIQTECRKLRASYSLFAQRVASLRDFGAHDVYQTCLGLQ